MPTVVSIEQRSDSAPPEPASAPPAPRAQGRIAALWNDLARRPLVMLAVALAIWGLTDVRSRGQVSAARPGLHRTDFTVYTEAGAAFFDGRNPYTVTNPRGWGYLYPPLFAILVAPLHALPPQLQVVVWFVTSLGLAWLAWRECRRLVQLTTAAGQSAAAALPRWLIAATAATVTLPTLNCLQRGQVGILKLYLLLLGLRLLVESRGWRKALAAGVVFAAAITLKITPALPVALIAIDQILAALRDRRWDALSHSDWQARKSRSTQRACGITLGIAGGLVAWMFVVPAGLVGSQRNSESLTQWWQLVATKACGSGYDLFAGDSYSLQNQSLLNAGRHLGNWTAHVFAGGSDDRRRVAEGEPLHVMDAPSAERALAALRATLALLAAGLVWQCGKTRDRLTLAAVFGLCTAATLVVAPIARAHYFLLLIPALPLVPLWFVRAGHERLARWAAWLPAGLVVSHYLASPLVGRVGLLGIGTAVWFAGCAGAMIVVARRASRTAQPAEVYSFRVRAGAAIAPPDQAVAAGRLKVDDRTVARRGLGSLPADLFHHERDG